VGETFTVSLAIYTVEALRGLQFGIDYDSAVVQLDEVSEGTFFGSWAAEHGLSTMVLGRASRASGGTAIPLSPPLVVIIVLGMGDDPGPRGAGRVFELRFTALAAGASPLSLRDVKAARIRLGQEGSMDYVPVRVHDGQVTVTAEGK
jgi:hypothetical protein